ncbi:WhiB family transcriptional regulator [Nocardia sp. IBHARD005]|uniref:WhiB family transcriptional regulator n=1 Tax=Nocardia sp. IBHARD005 TaxID=3457765 RepID=UPI004059CB26
MADPHWRDQGRCTTVGPDVFFVRTRAKAADAIAVCERCPVLLECAETVEASRITSGVHAGVWFGDSAATSGSTVARARQELKALIDDLKSVTHG